MCDFLSVFLTKYKTKKAMSDPKIAGSAVSGGVLKAETINTQSVDGNLSEWISLAKRCYPWQGISKTKRTNGNLDMNLRFTLININRKLLLAVRVFGFVVLSYCMVFYTLSS